MACEWVQYRGEEEAADIAMYHADWRCILWWWINSPSPKLLLNIVLLYYIKVLYKTALVALNFRIFFNYLQNHYFIKINVQYILEHCVGFRFLWTLELYLCFSPPNTSRRMQEWKYRGYQNEIGNWEWADDNSEKHQIFFQSDRIRGRCLLRVVKLISG